MIRGLLVLLVCLLPAAAFADGGVYIHKTAIAQNVTIPDQQAILCWSNGVERLAIQTQFAATGTNFAWVVPLPSKPVIEEATTGVFTTLEYLFRPNLVHDVLPLYAILLACVGGTYLGLTVRRNTPPRAADTLVSIAIALLLLPFSACVAVGLVLLLPISISRIRNGQEQPWLVIIVVVGLFIMSAMLLPALGGGKTQAAANGVSILNQQTIGIYDAATIAAKDPKALQEWFNENGYVLPPAANPVISNYVKRGWVFAAAKVRRDSANESTNAPHPLCFTFTSDKPIYPMQLTAIGNRQLKVDLFVFGSSRAEAKNFRTERCSKPQYIDAADHYPKTDELRVAHPTIRKWAGNLPVATKLSATLTSAMMAEDVKISWVPFTEVHPNIYSRQGALVTVANIGASIFAVGLLLVSLVVAFKRPWQPHLKAVAAIFAAAGILTSVIVFNNMTITDVHMVTLPRIRTIQNVRGLSLLTSDAKSVAQARAEIQEHKKDYGEISDQNYLLGGPIREEDSPGNYVLRESTNRVQFVWFDDQGGEHRLRE